MRRWIVLSCVLGFMVMLGSQAIAQDKPAADKQEADKSKEAPEKPTPTDPRFIALTKLAGDWTRPDKGDAVAVTYRVTSGGHAVMETLLPGTDYEMITMYHMDGPDLVVTHYCAAGNQPRMRAKGGDAKMIKFDFADGTNMNAAKDGHMHALTLTFVDADHLKAEWTWWKDGAAGGTEAFNFQRKKAK
jgi:hypothetical protein